MSGSTLPGGSRRPPGTTRTLPGGLQGLQGTTRTLPGGTWRYLEVPGGTYLEVIMTDRHQGSGWDGWIGTSIHPSIRPVPRRYPRFRYPVPEYRVLEVPGGVLGTAEVYIGP